MGHVVRIFKELIMLQECLEGLLVGEIIKRLLVLNEVLHALQTALHTVK